MQTTKEVIHSISKESYPPSLENTMTPIKLLLVYPNLPLMMSPAMSMAILNAIGKREGCEVEIFETTQYSSEFSNKHIRQSEIRAVRANKDN